jgi:hypothetical protein
MWDQNQETQELLDQFQLQYVAKMDFSTNWYAPPLFKLGSRIPLSYHEAVRLCNSNKQHLPELETWGDTQKFRDAMRENNLTMTFSGIYQDLTDMSKRFITSGHPFNAGWFTKNIIFHEISGASTSWDSDQCLALHDEIDHVVTYDEDGTMIFQVAHPQYQTNNYY